MAPSEGFWKAGLLPQDAFENCNYADAIPEFGGWHCTGCRYRCLAGFCEGPCSSIPEGQDKAHSPSQPRPQLTGCAQASLNLIRGTYRFQRGIAACLPRSRRTQAELEHRGHSHPQRVQTADKEDLSFPRIHGSKLTIAATKRFDQQRGHDR